MNKISLIAIAIFGIILYSCQDLNTFPEGDVVTTAQKTRAEASVNGIFAQFSQMMPNEDALGASRHNDIGYPSIMLFTDANGYDLVTEDNGYNWTGNDLDFADRSITSYESQIVWNDLYKMILTSNNVIAVIDRNTDDPTLKFYLAQGLAARAFDYFILAQLYQFNYSGHQSDPCVPKIT
jgi:hypothetical protein